MENNIFYKNLNEKNNSDISEKYNPDIGEKYIIKEKN